MLQNAVSMRRPIPDAIGAGTQGRRYSGVTKANHSIWTIGHSTRSLEEFIELLGEHKIEIVADVRQFPGSRRYPHFGRESLECALKKAGVGYVHFSELGGRRTPQPN